MAAKNCPETPRQKMINMMYIVLTAMLALNVAAEVLDAFKVVDTSLMQTLKAIDIKNNQVYSSFDQAYAENKEKVGEWKAKADLVKEKTDSLNSFIFTLKEDMVRATGYKPVNKENPLEHDDFYLVTEEGDTIIIKREDDLNYPSEYMLTKKNGEKLKRKLIEYREFLKDIVKNNDELKATLDQVLDTSEPPANMRDGGAKKSWEQDKFLEKPLIAVITLLSKLQIDVINSESNVVDYLYAQIDAGSFKFNKLGARVITESNVVLEGDEYVSEVFLAAEDTTQQPEIYINGNKVEVKDGKAIYRRSANQVGEFSWSGLIKYKTPEGILREYPFKQTYQVTKPSVTMSATNMNVFYRGLDNPFDIGAGGLPKENLSIEMTNGTVKRSGDKFVVRPGSLDPNGTKTVVKVYGKIGDERRLLGSSKWRVKKVPDPVAIVAGKSGGNLRKEVLLIQDGVLAELENFDFDFKYRVTEFDVQVSGAGGYVNIWPSKSNRFTAKQKQQFKTLKPNSLVYISNIKAVGDDGTTRELNPISFKIK